MTYPLWPKGGVKSRKVPLFPFAPVKVKNEIDLREEMQIMLEGNDSWPRRGHWILLRRMDRRQRCTCWNEKGAGEDQYSSDKSKFNEPQLKCPICAGEGWVYEDELHLARRRLVSPEIGLAAQEQLTDIGWFNINYICYYLQYYVNPTRGDKIIEIDLDDNGNPIRPIVRREMYRIAVAEPFRDQSGRIEFWRCSSKMEIV